MDKITEETILSYDDILEDGERSLESGSNLLNFSTYIDSIKDFIADNIHRDDNTQSRVSSSSSSPSSDSDVIRKDDDHLNLVNNKILYKLQNLEFIIYEEKRTSHINIKNMENQLNIIKNENKNLKDELIYIYDQLYDQADRYRAV